MSDWYPKRGKSQVNVEVVPSWGLGTKENVVMILVFMAVALVAFTFAIKTFYYTKTQDQVTLRLGSNLNDESMYLETQIINNATNLNSTLLMLISDLMAIESELNMTGSSGSLLSTRITALENMPFIKSINDVNPDASSRDLQLLVDLGLSINNDVNNSAITLSNTGVVTINGLQAGQVMPGDFMIDSIGMINILNDANMSKVTVDGSDIVTVLNNLQQEDSMLAMDIVTLQNTVNNLQVQITALESIGDMLNMTDMDLNMTLIQLLEQAMMNTARIDELESQFANFTSSGIPTGAMLPWTGTNMNVPNGYLLCDGSEYDMTTYEDLFMVIGTMYCGGGCSMGNLFAVPDMRGKVPVGQAASGAFVGTVGSSTGDETATVSIAQLPTHDHGGVTLDNTHTHLFDIALDTQSESSVSATPTFCKLSPGYTDNAIQQNAIGGANCPEPNPGTPFSNTDYDSILQVSTAFKQYTADTPANNGAHAHEIPDQGSGQGHNNIQPSLIMHYIIKT